MVTYKGIPVRLSADFSTETLQARKKRKDTLKVLKDKNCHQRIFYPEKSSLRYEGEIKTFSDKQKLRGFINTRPALQKMLKASLLLETKRQKYKKH